MSRWTLVVADLVREYHLSVDEVATLGSATFMLLLSGLSTRSRFVEAWTKKPKHMHDPAARAALVASARR